MNMQQILFVSFSDKDMDAQKIKLEQNQTIDSLLEFIGFLQKQLIKMDITIISVEYYDKIKDHFVRLDDETLSLILSSNRMIYIHLIILQSKNMYPSQLPQLLGRNFDPSVPFRINGIEVQINEVENAILGTGLKTWDGAIVLAKYFELYPFLLQNKSVLELGAGTGLVGISAGILGAKEVLLTDLSYSVDNLTSNIMINSSAFPKSTHIHTQVLDWTDVTTYTSKSKIWDVIIGADIVWLDHLIIPLVRVLNYCCKYSTLFYFAYQSRSSNTDKLLFESLERIFVIELIPTQSYPTDYINDKITLYKMVKKPLVEGTIS